MRGLRGGVARGRERGGAGDAAEGAGRVELELEGARRVGRVDDDGDGRVLEGALGQDAASPALARARSVLRCAALAWLCAQGRRRGELSWPRRTDGRGGGGGGSSLQAVLPPALRKAAASPEGALEGAMRSRERMVVVEQARERCRQGGEEESVGEGSSEGGADRGRVRATRGRLRGAGASCGQTGARGERSGLAPTRSSASSSSSPPRPALPPSPHPRPATRHVCQQGQALDFGPGGV